MAEDFVAPLVLLLFSRPGGLFHHTDNPRETVDHQSHYGVWSNSILGVDVGDSRRFSRCSDLDQCEDYLRRCRRVEASSPHLKFKTNPGLSLVRSISSKGRGQPSETRFRAETNSRTSRHPAIPMSLQKRKIKWMSSLPGSRRVQTGFCRSENKATTTVAPHSSETELQRYYFHGRSLVSMTSLY